MEKARGIPAWDLEKVKSRKDVFLEAQTDKKSTFLHWDKKSLQKMLSWNHNNKNSEAESYSVVTL